MNKKNQGMIIILGLMIAAVLIISGCSQASESQTGNVVKQKAAEPIKIGFLESLTGDVAAIGQNNKAAVEMAIEEVNAEGGINGRPLQLIYEDGKCNAKDAATAAQKLVNIDQVSAIIGGLCSSETLAAAPIAEGKAVMISPGSSSPAITNAGDYIFRDYPSDVFQGVYAARFAYDKLGARKVAVLYCLTDFAVGLQARFDDEFKRLGGTIVSEQSFEQSSRDLRSQLSKIKESNPDAVFFLGYTEAIISGLIQAEELGINAQIIGSDAWGDPTIPQKAGSAADGAIYFEVKTPVSGELKTKMKAHTGSDEMTIATPQAYDALKILAQVMREIGTNPSDIKDALYKINYTGYSGNIVFDENGDMLSADYIVKTYMDGKLADYQGD